MDSFLHNPIADMPGPEFLFFYAVVAAGILLACWWRMRRADPTAALPPLPVPSRPDPYEVAYLRGNDSEVTRLALFSLLEQGFLRVTETKWFWPWVEQRIELVPGHPGPGRLSPPERAVFDQLTVPQTPEEIFKSSEISARVKEHCSSYDSRFASEQLTGLPEAVPTALWIQLAGSSLIVGLGGYKLLVALSRGHHNVSFLIYMGLFALIMLNGICSSPRLSARGEQYLKQLQLAFEQQKQFAPQLQPDHLPLLVGLYGSEVLSGTAYAQYTPLFSAKSAGGGCGDGGCGGGCGGCGGCG